MNPDRQTRTRSIALALLLFPALQSGPAVSQEDDVFALSNAGSERYLEMRDVLLENVSDAALESRSEGTGIDAVYARVLGMLRNEPERYEAMQRTFNDFIARQADRVNPFSTPHRRIPGLSDEAAASFLGERLLKTEAFYYAESEFEITLVKSLAAEGLAGLDYPISRTVLFESLKTSQPAPVLEAIEESFGFLADPSTPERVDELIAMTKDDATLASLRRIKALTLRVLERRDDAKGRQTDP